MPTKCSRHQVWRQLLHTSVPQTCGLQSKDTHIRAGARHPNPNSSLDVGVFNNPCGVDVGSLRPLTDCKERPLTTMHKQHTWKSRSEAIHRASATHHHGARGRGVGHVIGAHTWDPARSPATHPLRHHWGVHHGAGASPGVPSGPHASRSWT